MKNPIKKVNGQATWIPEPGDLYLVTGRYYNSNKRFSMLFQNWNYAGGINLWRGSKWLYRQGKRYLITSVNNWLTMERGVGAHPN